MGFQTFLVAFIADLLAANRKLLEDVRLMQKMHEHDLVSYSRESETVK